MRPETTLPERWHPEHGFPGGGPKVVRLLLFALLHPPAAGFYVSLTPTTYPVRFSLHMSELLLDINLQLLPDDYFGGEWQVANRVLNQNNPTSPMAQASQLALMPGKLEARPAPDAPAQTGQWAVMRDEILNRPYLSFELPDEATRALVTRLRRSADGQHSQLNLYFASGMEMQLNRP